MSRNVRIVLLCEDQQHQAFARRFLRAMGWNLRDLRVEQATTGVGSAEQFVRERFPIELKQLRTDGTERKYLAVIIDGDSHGPTRRRSELEDACTNHGIQPPSDTDRVLICTPTWKIETWFAYLGGAEVDETRGDYPRLPRKSECKSHVKTLATMCRERQLRSPAPESLEDACAEYRRVFESA